MIDVMPRTEHEPTRPIVRDREGTRMLLHEALARSRQQEAIEAARQHALARRFVAGRRWARLARFATRRAARARAAAGVAALAAVTMPR
jgi:hypothetical protein